MRRIETKVLCSMEMMASPEIARRSPKRHEGEADPRPI
jgi:hypothetical protein